MCLIKKEMLVRVLFNFVGPFFGFPIQYTGSKNSVNMVLPLVLKRSAVLLTHQELYMNFGKTEVFAILALSLLSKKGTVFFFFFINFGAKRLVVMSPCIFNGNWKGSPQPSKSKVCSGIHHLQSSQHYKNISSIDSRSY